MSGFNVADFQMKLVSASCFGARVTQNCFTLGHLTGFWTTSLCVTYASTDIGLFPVFSLVCRVYFFLFLRRVHGLRSLRLFGDL